MSWWEEADDAECIDLPHLTVEFVPSEPLVILLADGSEHVIHQPFGFTRHLVAPPSSPPEPKEPQQ